MNTSFGKFLLLYILPIPVGVFGAFAFGAGYVWFSLIGVEEVLEEGGGVHFALGLMTIPYAILGFGWGFWLGHTVIKRIYKE